jgi:HTH-type transcriptional regulator/antitoxin HigA
LSVTPYSLLPTAHCIQPEPDDASEDVREREANAFAQDMLISADVWERKRPILLPDPSERAVRNVAQELRISPAIVAGRIRWETQNYKQLPALVGARQVREQFEEYKVGE